MRLVIVTGMSGAGKLTAMKMLEDIGYYCVDNLPVKLIDQLVELMTVPGSDIEKLALGLDVRLGQDFSQTVKSLRLLKEKGYKYEIVFMDASDETLVKRYKETRRLHPLATAKDSRIESGIGLEREILEEIKKEADYVFDTSALLTRELKQQLEKIFINKKDSMPFIVNIMSFGFKYGTPNDADLVFDVRFLPNPFYIDELKYKTGKDKEVRDYVMGFSDAGIFLEKLTDMLTFLLPGYVNEGKHQLVIAIGCTGGQHRSVTLAEELFKRLQDKKEYSFYLSHREILERKQ